MLMAPISPRVSRDMEQIAALNSKLSGAATHSVVYSQRYCFRQCEMGDDSFWLAFPFVGQHQARRDYNGGFFIVLISSRGRPITAHPAAATTPNSAASAKSSALYCMGCGRQYNQGWPEYCAYRKFPPELKQKYPNLYPSTSLYDHEWDKHGTCSGLSPEGYLSLSKQLRDSIAIPARYKAPEQPVRVTTAQLKKDFVAANPVLSEASLAVYCSGSGRFLSQLYVCFSSEGRPQACSQEIHTKAAKSCGQPDLLVRNVR